MMYFRDLVFNKNKLEQSLRENNSNSDDREIIRNKIISIEEEINFLKMLQISGIGIDFIDSRISDFKNKDKNSIDSLVLRYPIIEDGKIKDSRPSIKFEVYELLNKLLDSCDKNLDRGSGFIFTGPVGIGKTRIACSILIEYMRKRSYIIEPFGGRRARTCGFVTVFDLVSLSENRSFANYDKLEEIKKKDILIIDELCAEQNYSFKDSSDIIINKVIRDRYNNRRMTIITSNSSLDTFYSLYGERGSSVLLGRRFYFFVLSGTDRRFFDDQFVS